MRNSCYKETSSPMKVYIYTENNLKIISEKYLKNIETRTMFSFMYSNDDERDKQIKQLIHKVEILENALNLDIKIKQITNQFYANCVHEGLTKSEWVQYHKCYCAKDCGLMDMCTGAIHARFLTEAYMCESMQTIASKIVSYANEHLHVVLQCHRTQLGKNSCIFGPQTDILSEKRNLELSRGIIYNNDPERNALLIKMSEQVFHSKREKILRLVTEFIDSILELFNKK